MDTEVQVAFSAKPTYTQAQIRTARAMIRNCNNLSAETIATTIEAMAWTDIPPDITAKLFRDIAARRDNIPYLLANSQRKHPGGSGIRSDIPGDTVHMDIQWKTQEDRGTGAVHVLVIFCECTGFGRGYALHHKSTSRDAFCLWQLEMRSYGRVTKFVRIDAAS